MRRQIIEARKRVDKILLTDAALVGVIAAFLFAIQVGLPLSIQTQFVFNHDTFALPTLLTSAYVHHDTTHLLKNLSGFLVATSVVYWLCWQLRERRWFRITTILFLVMLPVLVNLSSYVIFEGLVPDATPSDRGFSGVGAGFVGFLFAAFFVWLNKRSSWSIAVYLSEGVAVFIVWVLALIYRGFGYWVLGLAVLGISLSGLGFYNQIDNTAVWTQWRKQLPDVIVGVSIVLMILFFIVALFPANFTNGDYTTNIFAHGAGFGWGMVIAFMARNVFRKQSNVEWESNSTRC